MNIYPESLDPEFVILVILNEVKRKLRLHFIDAHYGDCSASFGIHYDVDKLYIKWKTNWPVVRFRERVRNVMPGQDAWCQIWYDNYVAALKVQLFCDPSDTPLLSDISSKFGTHTSHTYCFELCKENAIDDVVKVINAYDIHWKKKHHFLKFLISKIINGAWKMWDLVSSRVSTTD